MPKRLPLQTTFEAGVASPLIYGRSDLPGYHKSAKNMLNMYPDSRGPAVSRFGLEYKFDMGQPTDRYGRIFTFRASFTTSFIVTATESELIITDRSGLVEGTTKILNGHFLDGGTDWGSNTSAEGSVTFPEHRCRLNSGSVPNISSPPEFAYVEQNVVGLVPDNAHSLKIDSHPVSLNPGDLMTVTVSTTQGGNDILSRTFSTLSNFEVTFVPGAASIWVRVNVSSTLEEFGQSPPRAGEPVEPLFRWASNVRDIDLISMVDFTTDPDAGFVTFPSPWTEDQLHDIQVEMAPDLQRMYFVHREVAPHQLELDITQAPVVWSFEESEFDWGAGEDAWTDEFPGAIAFFQGRLYLAATISEPVSIWGSQPGQANYNNFSDVAPGPSADPDDPIKVILARNADIQWMQGSKVLYVGCDNSEHVITSEGPFVHGADIETQQQSAYGSARMKTDWVSQSISFTSWDQRRLRLINFVTNTANMESEDLTFPSEHLTIGLITEMHHAANPVNRLWCPMADGKIVTCTYEKDRKISAWAPHETTGLVKSLTVVEEQGQSVVYMLVLRNDRLRILRLGRKEVFLDEYVERGYPEPTNTIFGLEHLEGEEVGIVGDGNLYPNAVVTGGQITAVGPAALDWVVGLSFLRSVETMPVDETMGGQGTVAMKKSWNRIFVRVLASILPNINGRRPPDRTPATLMNEREPNRSQDIIVQNVGWDYDGTITISQDLPFNLTVTGVYGELSEESL